MDLQIFHKQIKMDIVQIYFYCGAVYATILSIILIFDIFNLDDLIITNKLSFYLESIIFISVSSLIWPIALIPTVNHIISKY